MQLLYFRDAVAAQAQKAQLRLPLRATGTGDVPREEFTQMVDFMIGLAFVAMVVTPAIVATFQRSKSNDNEI